MLLPQHTFQLFLSDHDDMFLGHLEADDPPVVSALFCFVAELFDEELVHVVDFLWKSCIAIYVLQRLVEREDAHVVSHELELLVGVEVGQRDGFEHRIAGHLLQVSYTRGQRPGPAGLDLGLTNRELWQFLYMFLPCQCRMPTFARPWNVTDTAVFRSRTLTSRVLQLRPIPPPQPILRP
jgi:hypothetical protein